MKTALPLLLSITTAFVYMGRAQEVVNPFDNNRNEYNSLDFIGVFNDPNEGLKQQVFGYDWIRGLNGEESKVLPLSDPSDIDLQADGYIVIETGNFNGNGKDDIFYLVQQRNGWAYGVSEQSPELSPEDSLYDFTLQPPNFITVSVDIEEGVYPIVSVGDLDGDGIDEVVVGATKNDNLILEVISFKEENGALIPVRHGTSRVGTSVDRFDRDAISICTVDLDADGNAEIAISGLEKNTTIPEIRFNAFISILDVSEDGNFSLNEKARSVYDGNAIQDDYKGNDGDVSYIRTTLQCVRSDTTYDGSGVQSIFAALAYDFGNDQGNYNYFNTFHISTSPDLSEIFVTKGPIVEGGNSKFPFDAPLESAVGDVNRDGQDDIVVLVAESWAICTFEAGELVLKNIGKTGLSALDIENNALQQSVDRIAVGDIDRDGKADIISQTKFYNVDVFPNEHVFHIETFNVVDDFDIVFRGEYRYEIPSGSSKMNFGFAIGNLDGTDLKLGEPTNSFCELYRPIVAIGCVPYHFDNIENRVLDLSNLLAGNAIFNKVKMSSVSGTENSSEVQWSSSFAESEKLDISYVYEGFGGSAGVEQQHGKNFSSTNGTSTKMDAGFLQTADNDDIIEGYVTPIKMAEYPVLNNANDTTSWIVAVVPGPNEESKRENRSVTLLNYIPNYEVGNVLSYPRPDDPDLFYDRMKAKEGEPEDIHLIWNPGASGNLTVNKSGTSAASSVTQSLKTSVSSNSNFTSGSFHADITANGLGLGADYSRSTSYKEEQLQVFQQKFSQVDEFSITVEKLIAEGNYDYVVRPYLYWTENRFLKLSLSVEIPSGIGSNSWREKYGRKADPALNMPWRLDPLKSNDYIEENLLRTRSIRFDKVNPNPGDTVTAYIRVFNYSLKEMDTPVEFELYLGDPDKGGTLISDIFGNNFFDSQEILGVQGRNVVEVPILVTNEMIAGLDNRMYIVLDPGNKIDEIHEANNKGYVNIGYACNSLELDFSSVSIDELDINEGKQFLFSVFPNPASDRLNLSMEGSFEQIPTQSLSLSVLDFSGKQVHLTSFERYHTTYYTDISPLSAGIYFYQILQDGEPIHHGKIVINK